MNEQEVKQASTLTPSVVPTPTSEYQTFREDLRRQRVPLTGWRRRIPIPIPWPIRGARVLIWKQDPTVGELGIRKAYLPRRIFSGPKDVRIKTEGLASVSPNSLGDFIQTPGTDAFDAVHTFAVVRQTLTMVRRALAGAAVPWQWNGLQNTDPLKVFPHGLPDAMNAFYSRTKKSLKFGDFIKQGSSPPERVFTCRSFDIVAHETGHAILDSFKPNWLLVGNPPQTGGLHESFGDLTAIFLALSQMDQAEALIALTKGNLHDKNFLEDLAEQFGDALGRPNGLRNADNDLRLSEVSNEVHAISQVFTGAVYDILADIFGFERKPTLKDDAAVLYEVAQYTWGLVLRAMRAAPNSGATYVDVANKMLQLAASDGKPVEYRNFIRNQFTIREVVVSPTPLAESLAEDVMELAPNVQDDPDAVQDRSTSCGTMNLSEYGEEGSEDEALEAEIQVFRASLEEMAE